ncbi:beta-hydroxyacid dehydrogenase, 3-hydroxyisobutyrate dehydrogenase [Mycolicibacterium gilvum Spyr1]|uniref:Beta-hydroxyacid dehydrogenase, 3-hydroxyisobutyrate dehydrogenase n=1 Tax=Mycolicibacterium gilvum (strain DSM 45189 / LMG 24558 / Spyr1) TaxID=278137 RepID=E6TIW9_MYCSR|nr:beta-hydroxyacid dehydrogenase, 3-hydroxyisobutyrate dehydrogenase [Mycolicibacterium gilvum Spyr1]
MNIALGFLGLGNMGFPMMGRLLSAGHPVVVFDTDPAAVSRATALGADAAASVREVADRAGTVLASLPTPQVSNSVAEEVAGGSRVRRFVDLSTVGQHAAQRNSELLGPHGIAALDSPVSGGVHGAEAGTLAVMVSGPRHEFDALEPVWSAIGRATFVSEKAGAAQTMKLINNLIAATTLAVTAEAMVMGAKAGLDSQVMLDVLNAGSGGTHASRDKFPRAVLPRTFDYGFATGLMTKDVLLYLSETQAMGSPSALAEVVARVWRDTQDEEGPASDFTSVVKPMERRAGVTLGPQ